jgi:hypothetical protein
VLLLEPSRNCQVHKIEDWRHGEVWNELRNRALGDRGPGVRGACLDGVFQQSRCEHLPRNSRIRHNPSEVHQRVRLLGHSFCTGEFGEHYGWGFSPSVWGTTKYYCIFGWAGRTKEVRVWTESEWLPHWKTIPRPCSHCLWHVKRDGFYRQPNDPDKAHASVFYVGWV